MDLKAVALLEERRLRQGMSEVASESIEIADGVATRAEPGTWGNSGCGFGLTQPITTAHIDRLIDYHTAHAVEPRIDVCPFAHPSLIASLAGRGFNITALENVLFLELAGRPSIHTPHPPAACEVRRVDPNDPAGVRQFALTVCAGFAPPGEQPRDEAIALATRCAMHARTTCLVAFVDGVPAGAGSFDLFEGCAALFGLSVLPAFRRRGLQTALIAHRLRLAQEAGAVIATIGSAPAHDTERNVRRAGFQCAYTRIILARPGPGLVPVRY